MKKKHVYLLKNYNSNLITMLFRYNSVRAISIIIIIAFSFLFSNCSNEQKKISYEQLEKAKIYNDVKSKYNESILYSLYLPSSYDETKKHPIIIFFDAHAKGYNGVDLMKDYAEKYGYILVGSNNSKNGLTEEEYNYISTNLFNEIFNRFSINNNRVYLAGFSGGARVASSIATQRGGINGVIGFSASPGNNINNFVMKNVWFYGFCGDYDMNYNEMIQIESLLQKTKIKHTLTVFNGKHELPSKSKVEDLFVWLEADAMANNLKEKDTTKINYWLKSYQDSATLKVNTNDLIEALVIYNKIIMYFDNLTDVYKYKQLQLELLGNKKLQKYIEKENVIKEKETILQTTYQEEFLKRSLDWWITEMARYDEETLGIKDDKEVAMRMRVKSYLSLLAYSYSTNTLKNNMLNEAEHFINLYKIVDPTNSEHYYLLSTLYAIKNDYNGSLKALGDAINIGFDDYDRLLNDTLLSRYRTMDEFAKITKSIKR
ncbi:MAG: hypothetical protein A2X12_11645 [Bacteroidetes bacterium GWE2_29_8]|nr:MAG: hypothetical protein A2X12_11645 [Bacteroidetes bacterium GWE2_29_8]OFY24375.1 MAG: hypothetical protein A2X02_08265 [Bacteroidetes bacterium GWF2_29_10]